MLAGIREICVITTPQDQDQFIRLLGDGSQWGVELTYVVQPSPDGLAQAFILAEEFLAGAPSALVLGDNIFFGAHLTDLLASAVNRTQGATVFSFIGWQGFFKPANAVILQNLRPPYGFGQCKTLIAIGHDLISIPNRSTHLSQPSRILADMFAPDFDFRAFEAAALHFKRIIDQRLGFQMQPAALGCVKRNALSTATHGFPRRQARLFAFQIPQSCINCRESQGRDGADRRCMRGKQQVTPNPFNPVRVTPDQSRSQGVLQQRHDRGPTGANRIGIPGSTGPVAVVDRDHGGFLRDK